MGIVYTRVITPLEKQMCEVEDGVQGHSVTVTMKKKIKDVVVIIDREQLVSLDLVNL